MFTIYIYPLLFWGPLTSEPDLPKGPAKPSAPFGPFK